MLSGLGIECLQFHARDNKDSVRAALRSAITESDIVITLGGISVGDHDHVRSEQESIGFQEVFWKVKVRPGRPTYFGKAIIGGKTKYALGLPGNPVSAMTMLQTIGLAMLHRLDGLPPSECAVTLSAILEGDLIESDNRLELVRGRLSTRNNSLVVQPLERRDSHLVTGFAGANCLILLPANQSLEWGSTVGILPLSFSTLSGLTYS